MPGPAPDPNALRRDRKDDVGWTMLPSAGRLTPAPEWPLVGCTEREWELWVGLWRKPQAVLWEHAGQFLEVALLVRRLAEVEQPASPVTLGTLVAKQMADLLLTLPAMFKAHVNIAIDEVSAKRAKPVAAPRLSATERLRARNAEVG